MNSIEEEDDVLAQQNDEDDEEDEKSELDEQVDEMASQLHDEWRAPRLLEDGTYEPRIKQTRDQEWITESGAELKTDEQGRVYAEVDIANTKYSELPSEWQAENKVSAEVSIKLVIDAIEEDIPLEGAFVEAASAVVHEEWLKRNGEWAPEAQKLPYEQLSEEEKEKDRLFIQKAISVVQVEE